MHSYDFMRASLGTVRELNLAVGQFLSLFACLSPDLHPDRKNPDYSNEIELKVLGKSTLCTGKVLLLKSLCLKAQVLRPKSSI